MRHVAIERAYSKHMIHFFYFGRIPFGNIPGEGAVGKHRCHVDQAGRVPLRDVSIEFAACK